MAEDEHQADGEPTAPQGSAEGSGERAEKAEDGDQPRPPGTEPQAPGEETPLAEVAAGGAGAGGRLEELMAKRRGKGLSDAEAEELGRLLAEQERQPHSSAQSLRQAEGRGEGG